MAVDKKSQEFLRVCLNYGGNADTSTIRSETGMTRGETNYRFDKLEELGWIKIDQAESGFGDRTPPKVAILTDEGKDAINKGKAGNKILRDPEENERDDELTGSVEQKINDIRSEFHVLENKVNVAIEKMNKIDNSLGDQEDTDKPQNKSGEDGKNNKTSTVDSIEIEDLDDSVIMRDEFESVERDIDRLSETIDMVSQAISKGDYTQEETSQDDLEDKLDEIEESIDKIKSEQRYFNEWISTAEKHLKAMRLFFDDHDVNFNTYVKKASDN